MRTGDSKPVQIWLKSLFQTTIIYTVLTILHKSSSTLVSTWLNALNWIVTTCLLRIMNFYQLLTTSWALVCFCAVEFFLLELVLSFVLRFQLVSTLRQIATRTSQSWFEVKLLTTAVRILFWIICHKVDKNPVSNPWSWS